MNSNNIQINLTHAEAFFILEYFLDEKIYNLLPLLDNDKNLLMIFARMLCEIESKANFPIGNSKEERIKNSMKTLIQEFGNAEELNHLTLKHKDSVAP